MRRIVLALSLLFVTHAATGAVLLRTAEVDGGVRVVLAPAVPGETIAVQVTFRAGSSRDGEGAFGTARMASLVVGGRLRGFAAELNQERALFTASAPSAGELAAVLAPLRHALEDRPLLPEEWERARAESAGSGTEGDAEGTLLRLVYGRRPHGHSANAVSPEVSPEEVRRFLAARYTPPEAVIALAGTFDPAEVTRIVAGVFAGLPPARRARPCERYATRLRRQRSATLELPVRVTEIHWGYPTAASGTADWYALNILADIIGQGPGSRLQRRLVAGGLAADLGEGETEWPCASSIFRMRARLPAAGGSPAAVMKAADEELERLGSELVSGAELETAREQERAWAAEQLATAAGIANAAARALLFYGDPERINTEAELMSAVTAEDVRRVARRYLAPRNRAVIVVMPSIPAKNARSLFGRMDHAVRASAIGAIHMR